MIIKLNDDEKIDLSDPLKISIEIDFNGSQPNTYDVDKANAEAYKSGSFVGDIRKGGSCNFESYSIIPHCNGTHTECCGHITYDRIYVNQLFSLILFKAYLITVDPVKYESQINESYNPDLLRGDFIITSVMIPENFSADGLIIRTTPNDKSKLNRRYSDTGFPFFTNEAMKKIVSLGIKHLLVDMPSVDRMFDEGKLSNHHIYWDVNKNNEVNDKVSKKTISEMIYVDDFIEDGYYYCSIQIPDWKGDAAPSRIFLYKILNN